MFAIACGSMVAACGRVRFTGPRAPDAAVSDLASTSDGASLFDVRTDGGLLDGASIDGGMGDGGWIDGPLRDGSIDSAAPSFDAARAIDGAVGPDGPLDVPDFDVRNDVVRYGAPVVYDLATGLLGNLPPPGTTNADGGVPQTFANGWAYRVRARTEFGFYGNLVSGGNVPGAIVMPLGWNTSSQKGWGCIGTAAPSVRGQRGIIMLGSWALRRQARGTDPIDALLICPENNCQPVLEWTAPGAGRAEIHVEIILDPCTPGSMGTGGDVEWHVVAGRPGAFTQYGPPRYLGCNDANGRVTTPAPLAAPVALDFTDIPLQMGDVVFLAARIGDHDAGDGSLVRGRVVFEPRE